MITKKLIKLYSDENFTVNENRELTVFTHKNLLEPKIVIENREYITSEPIKHIVLLRNYIMQNSEIQLKSQENKTLSHIDLEDSNITNITIRYMEMKK